MNQRKKDTLVLVGFAAFVVLLTLTAFSYAFGIAALVLGIAEIAAWVVLEYVSSWAAARRHRVKNK